MLFIWPVFGGVPGWNGLGFEIKDTLAEVEPSENLPEPAS